MLSSQEFQTLIKGGAALDLNAVAPKPASWILDITWLNIISLSELHQFDDLPSKVNIVLMSLISQIGHSVENV